MAIYIAIRKLREDSESVIYTFGPDETRMGQLRLQKDSGDVSLLKPVAGDEKETFFSRAAYKVKRHWEEGRFPEVTCWAS